MHLLFTSRLVLRPHKLLIRFNEFMTIRTQMLHIFQYMLFLCSILRKAISVCFSYHSFLGAIQPAAKCFCLCILFQVFIIVCFQNKCKVYLRICKYIYNYIHDKTICLFFYYFILVLLLIIIEHLFFIRTFSHM